MTLFRRRKVSNYQPPEEPTRYPDGVCVVTESGRYYLKGVTKYKIKSDTVFKSWDFPVVLESTDAAISQYQPSLRRLGFRDGTLIRDIYDQRLYIIADGLRVPVTSVDMYKLLDIDNRKIPYVSHEDVIFHKEKESE